MKHDIQLDVATGRTRKTSIWKNKKMYWSELVKRLSTSVHTSETFREYMAATKDDQASIKDVGGYVGGYLRAGRRKVDHVVHRQVLTLDLDFAHSGFWQDLTLFRTEAAVLHATHKHHPDSPRYRLVMPLSREVAPAEYEAIARKVAGGLNIELFDNTTFEPHRLMYWPSSPKDVEYYYMRQDGPPLDADAVLSSYIDWTDSSLWPTSDRFGDKVRGAVGKQEDPETKGGIVGAFCRSYDVHAAIEAFLPDTYATTKHDGRYTYTKGSTSGGMVVYDDKFAYSHHGTDPAVGLCNSFDLVRLHRFGHLDTGNESGHRTKSYTKMEQLAQSDDRVKSAIASETLATAQYDFAEPLDLSETEADVNDWMVKLEANKQGKYTTAAANFSLILENDPRLRGVFSYNRFENRHYLQGTVPWRKLNGPEPVRDVDFAGVRNYLDRIYGLASKQKIDDALALEFERNAFHPVRDYLKALRWDGVPRIDRLLVEFFGTPDNIYYHEAIRKTLVGAVARIFVPGTKFDQVLTLTGDEGEGKSSFIDRLGMGWYSDTFTTVHGKEAFEQIQGVWLMEIAELAGFRKAEAEAVKHFLTKREDSYRPAYGHVKETFKRQVVFIATTNKADFLKQPKGNRRFNPVDTNKARATKHAANPDDLPQSEVNQIWAEAVTLYRNGEPLTLSAPAEETARNERFMHSEADERTGLIEEYLAKKLPANWSTMDIPDRRQYLRDPLRPKGVHLRQAVCVAEVWVECMGREPNEMDKYKTREYNDILRDLPGWRRGKSTKTFGEYGVQRYYERIN